jgi:hypothetical protein
MGNELGAAAVKTAPALGVAAASAGGWGMQDWVYAATFGYVVLQAAYLIWKWNRERKAK